LMGLSDLVKSHIILSPLTPHETRL
jgi:hypothetical protein